MLTLFISHKLKEQQNQFTCWSVSVERHKFGKNQCAKACITYAWNARVARKISNSKSFNSLRKFHDFSRLIFLNSMIFPGFLGFFQIPWFFQVWKKFFFIFQVSMIFPEAGNPVIQYYMSINDSQDFWCYGI